MSIENNKMITLGSAYSVGYDKRRMIQQSNDNLVKKKPELFESGVFLIKDNEDLPSFGPVMGLEKIVSRSKNQNGPTGGRILFTKDNYGHVHSGLGGAGGTQCEAIDIVVGSLGNESRVYTSDIQSRANFASDAARIYLTERGSLEHYFGLGTPNTCFAANMKSGIGIKADHTYAIGREEVRILVGSANYTPKDSSDLLATGIRSIKPKITLARTTEKDIQAAVLGGNLKEYLRKLVKKIMKIHSKVQTLEQKLIKLEISYAVHNHQGAGVGVIQTAPAVNAVTHTGGSVPNFFKDTLSNILDNVNTNIEQLESLGLSSFSTSAETDELIQGASDICSSTVFIGK